MKPSCPKCLACPKHISKFGSFYRTSDSQTIKRFKCNSCLKHFSSATFSPCYKQKRRRLNNALRNNLCSSMSMRRFAKLYKTSRTTVKRKLDFLANQARLNQAQWLKQQDLFVEIQFDDLETFEHSKCKPITVTMVVNSDRKILGYGVAQIGAKGLLTKAAKAKYGKRPNKSLRMRRTLFNELSPYISEKALIKSDKNPFYKPLIKRQFPKASHETFKGERSSLTGQGELKKVAYDPLFRINHTFAMLRANINRLVRKTWCTSKKIEALDNHIAIYVDFHNQVLT